MRGGAIYYSLNSDFKEFLLKDNTFINNSAYKGAYAYYQVEGEEILYQNNKFVDN